jgi:Trk K+ transport system NAD-binding subunit
VPEVLRQAHASSARAVVAATSNELINLEVALLVREINPTQRVVLRLADIQLADTLRQAANVRLALSIPALAAPAFVAALFGDRVQTVFLVEGKLLAAIDLVVQPGDPILDGQTVRALAVDFQFVPKGLFNADKKPYAGFLDARLQPGDRLNAIISFKDLHRLLQREAPVRGWAVDVTGFPVLARPWLTQLVRTAQRISAEEADRTVERLPVCLATDLTRGQAEDLIYQLGRQNITWQLRKTGSGDGRPA